MMMIRSTAAIRRIASAMAPKQSLLRATSLAAPTEAHQNAFKSSSIQKSNIIVENRRFSTAANNLGSILQREINEEDEAAAEFGGQLPPELAELQADIAEKWTIIEGISGSDKETGSGASIRLFKKSDGSNGAKIGVVFHCQDTEEDIPFDENEFLSGEQEESEEEPAQAVRFGVTVSKGDKTVVIQCRCGGDGEISVENVTVRDLDSESVVTALAGGENLNAALYQGPEFSELAEDLQESFQEYVVKECGIDEDVAAFISMYADYREQIEYVDWMKTAIDILD